MNYIIGYNGYNSRVLLAKVDKTHRDEYYTRYFYIEDDDIIININWDFFKKGELVKYVETDERVDEYTSLQIAEKMLIKAVFIYDL